MRLTVLGVLCTASLLDAAPTESPVADAAQRGDAETVRTLLMQGADVNAAQGDGMTALHWSALNGDAAMAEVLVYAGANLESTTRLGAYTALHLAARSGSAEVVGRLVEAGADVGARTSTGVTPLHLAAAAGVGASIDHLVSGGADIDALESASRQTPLIFAAAAGRLEALDRLLGAGADISVPTTVIDFAERSRRDGQDRRRRQELQEAIRKSEMPLTQEEAAQAEAEAAEARGLRSRPPGEPDAAARPQGEDPPQPAAPGQDSAALADPVVVPDPELGTSPNAPPDPALGASSNVAHREEPAKPNEAGAPREEKAAEPKAEEARVAAASRDPKGDPTLVPLSYDDLVGRQGGMTALHYAIRDGHGDVVRSLLAAGADVNGVTDGDGSSPLVIATINGHYDLALYLLEQGADPNLASEDGVTPLYATIANRWAPKALYPQPTAFKQQVASYLDLMEALLIGGADPDARVSTHIWYASFNFDLLGVNFMGATPFWRAAYATDVPAMKLLVAYGADAGIPTRKPPERRGRRGDDEDGGETPDEDPSGLLPIEAGGPGIPPIVAAAGVGFGRARAGNSHRHAPDSWLAAAQYLIEELGVDPNARDHDGFSALHYAAARGDNELIEYLTGKGADPLVVARTGQTTVDMANGPIQRVQPFFETIALLEGMGAKNNHKCQSC